MQSMNAPVNAQKTSAPELDSAAKASSAFRTIGEVATQLNVPPHVLRFWESKFTQVRPHKRRGGHRYYRPQDIECLQEIKHLLYDRGLTIKGAQKFLADKRKTDKTAEQRSLFASNDDAPGDVSAEALRTIYNELCEIKELLEK